MQGCIADPVVIIGVGRLVIEGVWEVMSRALVLAAASARLAVGRTGILSIVIAKGSSGCLIGGCQDPISPPVDTQPTIAVGTGDFVAGNGT